MKSDEVMERWGRCRALLVLAALVVSTAAATATADPPVQEDAPAAESVEALRADLDQARRELDAAKTLADARKREARVEEQTSKAYRKMLYEVVTRLAKAQADGKETTAVELLDTAVKSAFRPKRMEVQALGDVTHELSWMYGRIDAHEQASVYAADAVRAREAAFGETDKRTIESMERLAGALSASGRVEEAIEVRRRLVERGDRGLGIDHEKTIGALVFISWDLYDLARWEEAEQALGVLVGRLRARGKPGDRDDKDAIPYMARRAEVLQQLGRLDEAEALLREVMAISLRIHGPDDEETFDIKARLALILLDLGRTGEEPARLERELAELADFMSEIRQPFKSEAYGRLLTRLGEYEEAERQLLARYRYESKFSNPRIRNCVRALIALYDAWGNADEAARFRDMLAGSTPGPVDGEGDEGGEGDED